MYNEVMINIFIYLSYSTLISINPVEKAKEHVMFTSILDYNGK